MNFHLFKNKNVWAVTDDHSGQKLPPKIHWPYIKTVTKNEAKFNTAEAEAAIKTNGVYFYKETILFTVIEGVVI